MPIDWDSLALPKTPKGSKPVALAKDEKQKAKRASIDKAYDAVDARDKLISVVSGRQLSKRGGPDIKITRHHMDRRSQAPGRVADVHNIISVSVREANYLDLHALVPVNAAGEEVTDIRQIAGFAWNRNMVPGTAPAKIKPRTVLELRSR